VVITRFMRAYTNPTWLKKETPHLLEIQNTTQHLIMMSVIVSKGGPLNRWVVWVNNDVPVWVSYIWVIMPS
jgi:hypothetical protein